MTLDDAEKLCRAIDAFDPDEAARICDENNEPPTCLACNGEYRSVEYGQDPSALDDDCAHETVTKLARSLLAVLPVVRAAEAWRLGMVDAPPIRIDEMDLLRAIDTMRLALEKP